MSGPPPGLDQQGIPVPPPPMMHGSNGAPVPPPPPHHHHHHHPPPIGPMGAIPPPMPPHQPFPVSAPSTNGSSPVPNGSKQGSQTSTPQESEIPQDASQGPIPLPQHPQNFDLASYVYNVGFIHTAWADTALDISPHPRLRLHALFASRSPVLYRYLSAANSPSPPYHITIQTEDKNITQMSLSMALATLYGHTLDLSNCDLATAKGLLASGYLLGIESVANSGMQVILNSLSKENLEDVFRFATAGSESSFDDITLQYQGPYTPYTSSLVSILVEYILSNFNASTRPIDPAFKDVLLNLPFHLMKQICESEKLLVKNHMERHAFAREIIAARREHRRCNSISSPYEENVVLAFGGGKGGVEVIRKTAGKKKSYWKASN